MKKIKKSKGFTLTEVILTLAIAAIIIASVFLIYNKVEMESRVKIERENVSTIMTATRSLFANQADFTGWSMKVLINSHLLPESFTLSNGTYKDAWGGNVNTGTVTPGNSGNINISGVILSYVVPADACSKFVTSIFPLVDGITVNDQTVKDINVRYEDMTKLNIEDITEDCKNIHYTNAATVDITFY